MGLTDRLAAAQRARTESQQPATEKSPATTNAGPAKAGAARASKRDPFEDVKRAVHAQLVAAVVNVAAPSAFETLVTARKVEPTSVPATV